MYVKKFEADSLDEALKTVKRELGPDAIILKTVTNKGLKGAFKKSRIEITAAISEQSYTKKAKVDHVLSDEQKEKFYQSPAETINQSINGYSSNKVSSSGYGSLGLNKVVNSVNKATTSIKNSLDDFLSVEAPVENNNQRMINNSRVVHEAVSTDAVEETLSSDFHRESSIYHFDLEMKQTIKSQQNKIEILERKIQELAKSMTVAASIESTADKNLYDLRQTLKTLDLNDRVISPILDKAKFELTKSELEDADMIYDFALRELHSLIKTTLPKFSSTNTNEKSVTTVLISDNTSGQTSMALKLSVLQENVAVIRYCDDNNDSFNHDFAAKVFNLDVQKATSLSELITFTRKAYEAGKNVVVDMKISSQEDSSKKLIETLKRTFENLEVLINISAINSEIYNRKILSKYKQVSNGVIISYVDQCMNFGPLVNIHFDFNELPLMFYGTGPVVPDDIESATADRLLAGMFKL